MRIHFHQRYKRRQTLPVNSHNYQSRTKPKINSIKIGKSLLQTLPLLHQNRTIERYNESKGCYQCQHFLFHYGTIEMVGQEWRFLFCHSPIETVISGVTYALCHFLFHYVTIETMLKTKSPSGAKCFLFYYSSIETSIVCSNSRSHVRLSILLQYD